MSLPRYNGTSETNKLRRLLRFTASQLYELSTVAQFDDCANFSTVCPGIVVALQYLRVCDRDRLIFPG